MQIAAALQAAAEIARAAGALLRRGWGQATQVDFKGEIDLVTEFDRQSEALILAALSERFPDHHILAEERGDAGAGNSPYTWLVDPLDGTTNFAHSFPVFAVSIGLQHHGESILGVIYDPLRDELFSAGRGLGAHLNGAPIQVSRTETLNAALLGTGFAYNRSAAAAEVVDHLARFVELSQGVRRAGAAALDLAYVACGRLDGFWEINLQPWDVAAGSILIHEAGGSVTDFAGRNRGAPCGGPVLASNGRLHADMLRVLAPTTR